MMKSKSLVFFGNERVVTGLPTKAPTIQALISNGYNIACVVIAQNQLGKSRKNKPTEVLEIAKLYNIPVLSPKKIGDINGKLKSYKPDAGVLVAYGKIIPQTTIDLFPAGIINIHPSLLPKHRGSTPIESTILDGDSQAGVSLMRLSSEMDAGPVLAQSAVKLNGSETKEHLAEQLLNIGKDLLIDHLPLIIEGTAKQLAQDDKKATYDRLIDKNLGNIDTAKPALQLEREVRAYSQWPKSRINIGGIDVVVTTAVAINNIKLKPGELSTDNKQLLIGTADGALQITGLIPAGKKPMDAESFLNGYKYKYKL